MTVVPLYMHLVPIAPFLNGYKKSGANFGCRISKCGLVMAQRICHEKCKQLYQNKTAKCLATEKKWGVLMMRQDVFETRQQIYISVVRDGGSRRWMMGGRRFETLSRNVGHQSFGDECTASYKNRYFNYTITKAKELA